MLRVLLTRLKAPSRKVQLTGDKDMETEGKIDKARGSAHNVAGM